MGIKLRDLIRQVRACKTQAEERETVAKECANIRTAMKSTDNAERHQSVAKLLFIHMLGYPTHFGQVECLKLIASQTFPEKRMGYLGLMAMVDERHEVLMLVTNSIKQDMNHANPYIAGLALCTLGNLASPEMARDLQTEVERQLKTSSNPYIQKKVLLVALRSIRKVPDLLPIYLPYVKQSLTDKNPSIVLVGLALAMEMIQIKPKLKKKFSKYVDTLVKYLKNILTSGYSPDRDIGGINDPFLQIRIIKFLCVVGEGNAEASEQMNDVLAQVATNTEPSKNPGNAILYECVKTVMSIEAESGLRVMAVNILGRFLLNRDNNIRYVALNTLCQSVKQNMQAIQRHRNTIVECLKDSDVSIRARALDLIYCLVNKSNVESLVHELVTYLQSPNTEKDFRSDLTSRVTEVVERYAPNPKWHIDTLIEVLKISGNVTKLKVPFRLSMLITDNPNLRPYAIFTLYKSFTTDQSQTNLVIVSLWALGEFGDILTTSEGAASANEQSKSGSFSPIPEATVISSVRNCLAKSANPPSLIKQYCLMTLLKFSVRFRSSEVEIQNILQPYRSSISTELQARACEFSVFLEGEYADLRSPTLATMPTITKRTMFPEELGETPEEPQESEKTEPGSTATISATPVTSSSPLDLLGLDMGMGTVPAAPVKMQGNPVDLLADIFGSSMPPSSNAQQSTANGGLSFDMFASSGNLEFNSSAPSFPDLVAFNQSGIKAVFSFEPIKCPGGQFRINATFTSSRSENIEQFEFKAAVPKYIRIRLSPASGSTLYGEGQGPAITQQIEVINTTPDKPLLMKIKIDGIVNGSAISETGQINDFPPGL